MKFITLPSKRVFLLILLSVSFIGFAIGLKNYQNGGEIVKNVQVSPIPTVDEKDTDGDGLKDWEEALYGTDPLKKDTDGNGIPDNIEVKNGTVGPKTESLLAQVDNSKKTAEKLTESDKITRNMLYDFLVTKSKDGVNSAYIGDLSKRAGNDIFAIKINTTLYKKENLKIINGETSDDNALQYANDLVVLQKMYPVDGKSLSFPGISSAEDPAFATWSIKMSTYYKKIADAFLQVPVPPDLAGVHLIMTNDLSQISQYYKIISLAYDDPMTAISAVPKIATTQKDLLDTLLNAESYLETRGIIFSKELGLYIKKP